MNSEYFLHNISENSYDTKKRNFPSMHLVHFEVLILISSLIFIAILVALTALVSRDGIPSQVQEQSYKLLYDTLILTLIALICSFGAMIVTIIRLFFGPIIKALFKKGSPNIELRLKTMYSYLKKTEQNIIRPYDPDFILALASFILLAVAGSLFASKVLKII